MNEPDRDGEPLSQVAIRVLGRTEMRDIVAVLKLKLRPGMEARRTARHIDKAITATASRTSFIRNSAYATSPLRSGPSAPTTGFIARWAVTPCITHRSVAR